MNINSKKITVEILEVCATHNVNPVLVDNNQLVAVSEGVLEGDLVEGVRYNSPEHMSGWWLTTEKYNGDINTIKTEHFYHLLEKRPDLVKYLALPYGFRFFQKGYKDGPEKIWFDEKIAKNEI